ncbi:MAG: fumarylacetoacetate hydrolase family protein [Candidatus Saliniplasma sp.]
MQRKVRFSDESGNVMIGDWKDHGIESGNLIYDPSEVNILPPSKPTKMICVGRNYIKHAEEMNNELPEKPLLFIKTPNCIVGHEDTIELLEGKERVDYEAELAVVIGRQCKFVKKGNALDVVEGYSCMIDVTNRDDQMWEKNWVRGKAFDDSAPVGPVIVPYNSTCEDAGIQLRLNDEIKQDSTIDNMYFSVPELIEEITKYMTLERGDIIATGTPEGVGPLQDGDTVEVEIEGIGTLRNHFRKP